MIVKTEGGVTAAKGFSAAGCAAGIKKPGVDDMAMIVSETPCVLAGTFTTNVVKAAPVIWDRDIVRKGRGSAVVINAGVANACTGQTGMEYCAATAEAASEALKVEPDTVLVASTGVIGRQLPIDKITEGVRVLAGSLSDTAEAAGRAARAIMTTDTVPKQAAVSVTFSDGTTAFVGGMAKGSGMIHPNMCTMLCFITTDACISGGLLQEALSSVVPDTFNMVSVDGDTSTNDTCLVLANGLAENRAITEKDSDYELFREALLQVSTSLARMMAKDGEGATCLFECIVKGAASKEDAKVLARSVVSSNLTKAMIAGHDANFGRVLCALGYSGVQFDPSAVSLWLESKAGSVPVYERGTPLSFDEDYATAVLSEDEVRCIADMGAGDAWAAAWGCDLTYDYVRINADYRS